MEPETVTHYLLYCITYVAQRRRLRHTLGRDRSLGLETLGDTKMMKPLMAYINDTRRFEESYGDLQLAEQDKDQQQT